MPYARLNERGRDATVTPLAFAELPANVREKLASKPTARPAVKKPATPITRTSAASGRVRPAPPKAAPRPVREGCVRVTTRPPVASPDRVAARARADERLRRAGVPEAIIGAAGPAASGNVHRDKADEALRARGVPEAIIHAIPDGGRR